MREEMGSFHPAGRIGLMGVFAGFTTTAVVLGSIGLGLYLSAQATISSSIKGSSPQMVAPSTWTPVGETIGTPTSLPVTAPPSPSHATIGPPELPRTKSKSGMTQVVHIARHGESLLFISMLYGVPATLVAEANGVSEDAVIVEGMVLIIPL